MPVVERITHTERRVALDLDACIECRSCASACFYGHDEMPVIAFARVGAAMLPALCRQCEDAPCVAACPVEAMVRDEDGTIRRLTFRCQGCESCVGACPFGILRCQTFDGAIAKCDLCEDRLHTGAEPRCVVSCPSGALRFCDEREADGLGLLVLGSRTLGEHPIKRR